MLQHWLCNFCLQAINLSARFYTQWKWEYTAGQCCCCWQNHFLNIFLSITVKKYRKKKNRICCHSIVDCRLKWRWRGGSWKKMKSPGAGFTLPSAELFFSGPQWYLPTCVGKERCYNDNNTFPKVWFLSFLLIYLCSVLLNMQQTEVLNLFILWMIIDSATWDFDLGYWI